MGLFDAIASTVNTGLQIGGGLFGAHLDRKNQRVQWANEYNAQKEFAQNGIRWKVEDAKAAGLHPLAALGAQTASYSPQAIQHGNMSEVLANAGQNIGRAIQAKFSNEERELANLQLDSARLDNDYKRAQIGLVQAQAARMERDDVFQQALNSERAVNNQQQVPSMPLTGKRGSGQVAKIGAVEVKPDEVTSTSPDRSHGAGVHTAYIFSRVGNSIMAHFNESAGDSLSDDAWLGTSAKLNYIKSALNGSISGPPREFWSSLEKKKFDSGFYYWKFNPALFAWSLVPKRVPVSKKSLRNTANKFIPGTFYGR